PSPSPLVASVLLLRLPPRPAPFPYTTLFRSRACRHLPAGAVGRRRRRRHRGPATGRGRRTAGGHRDRGRDVPGGPARRGGPAARDRKSTRLNSSHVSISYAVFCLEKKRSSCG